MKTTHRRSRVSSTRPKRKTPSVPRISARGSPRRWRPTRALSVASVTERRHETRRESKDFAERINERERKFARADRAASGTTGGATSVTLAVRMVSKESAEAPAPTLSVAVDADTAVAVRLEENASTTLREAEVEFDSVRSRLNETTISQVRDQISRVRGQIERAREKMAEGDMSRARKDGERALNDATALRTFLKAQNRSEQNILPATLSDETRGRFPRGRTEQRKIRRTSRSPTTALNSGFTDERCE